MHKIIQIKDQEPNYNYMETKQYKTNLKREIKKWTN